MPEIIYCALAGLLITTQSSFNARLNEKIGGIETVTLAHFIGLIGSLIALYFIGKGDFSKIQEVNKLYLTGGFLGVAIVFGITSSVGTLGPSLTMGIVVISQLIMGLIIEWGGLFGHEKINFSLNQPIGVILMIIGLIVLKAK